MFKFELGQKVTIESLNKEGQITGMFRYSPVMNGTVVTEYEVSYKGGNNFIVDPILGVSECVSYKYTRVRFPEGDLKSIVCDQSGFDDMIDALRYAIMRLPKGTLQIKSDPVEGSMVENFRNLWHKTIEQSKDLPAKCSLHVWKTYEGFTNRYDYCEKCDTKRS